MLVAFLELDDFVVEGVGDVYLLISLLFDAPLVYLAFAVPGQGGFTGCMNPAYLFSRQLNQKNRFFDQLLTFIP